MAYAILNPAALDAYPITALTWLLVLLAPKDPARPVLVDFLTWTLQAPPTCWTPGPISAPFKSCWASVAKDNGRWFECLGDLFKDGTETRRIDDLLTDHPRMHHEIGRRLKVQEQQPSIIPTSRVDARERRTFGRDFPSLPTGQEAAKGTY